MSEPKARPIIFSAWSVQRILTGEKTQTRRAIKPQPDMMDDWRRRASVLSDGRAKYGQPQVDLLWVRETWCGATSCGYDAREDGGAYWYKATDEGQCMGPWSPSIFMPRKASRITLRIKDIRVERVREISEENAIAEGCEIGHGLDDTNPFFAKEAYRQIWNSIYAKPKPKKNHGEIIHYESYPWSEADRDPRETINGKPHYCYPSPYVWIIEFVREE